MAFADATRDIWRGAQEDDPYADWYLLRIEQRLQRSGATLETLKFEIRELAGDSQLEWTAAQSTEPARVQLRFATPYAYRGAHLLADFDRVARLVLTSGYLGILTGEAADGLVNRGGRAVRSAFDAVNGYRRFDVDRDAILSGTAVAQRARAAMGEVPAEVLAEECLASLRPRRTRHVVQDDLEVLDGGSAVSEGQPEITLPNTDGKA